VYKNILNSSRDDQIDYIMGVAWEGVKSKWCGCPRQQR